MGKQFQLNKRRVLSNQDVRESFVPVKADLANLRKKSSSRTTENRLRNAQLRDTLDENAQETSFTRDNLPVELEKYWKQRHSLFSLFDHGIRMDEEGWWSVTPELIAAHIAERCRGNVVVDAFCGVGGNSIQLAFVCEKVIAIDNNPTRLACAAHNAAIYGVEDRIHFVLADFKDWIEEYAFMPDNETIDAIFLSRVFVFAHFSRPTFQMARSAAPWGGIDYRSLQPPASPQLPSFYSLDSLVPYTGKQLYEMSSRLTKNIAMYLPKNTALPEIAAMTGNTREQMEVEEAWSRGRLKAITVYLGELVQHNK